MEQKNVAIAYNIGLLEKDICKKDNWLECIEGRIMLQELAEK